MHTKQGIYMESYISKADDCLYLSIRDFARRFSGWTESSIRWLIYNNTNGFNERVVKRIGKVKILLSVPDFWLWIESQNEKKTKGV